jgi:diguanylate cyclase (GGDEF)-like protein
MPSSFMALVRNAILLFALVFVYGIVNFRMPKRKILGEILAGIATGLFAILIIMNPWEMESGLIFDARSVLLSVVAAFFGYVPALIAGVFAIAYRIFLGGDGVYAGVLTVIVSVTMGLLWRSLRSGKPKIRYFHEFFFFGLAVHVLVLLCQLAIPWPKAFDVIKNIALPFLVLYPILTAILGVALHHQRERNEQELTIRKDHVLLRALIESPEGLSAMAVDADGRILVFNSEFTTMIHRMSRNVPVVGDLLLDLVPDETIRGQMAADMSRAFAGEAFVVLRDDVNEHVTFEIKWSPIRDDTGAIVGATEFLQDVTERVRKDREILNLTRHDPLTGLMNRRAYSEELKRPMSEFRLPVSVVMADINGLKITNDAFGHAAGDQLLLLITEMFRRHFRSDDMIFRIGGDEFVVFLQETPRAMADAIVDAIKSEMERTVLFGLTVSVSFGIDTDVDGSELLDSIKFAEIEMYNHKLFEVSSNRGETIKAILSTLNLKNPREELHSRRVGEFCQLIGEGLGMRKEEVSVLKMLGNLHDIGKIAIEDSILNKSSPLTPEEWTIIRRHPEIGYRILASSTEFADIAEDILAHHERWDGKGYPKGLKGEQIPLRARIIAVADTFEAMTADRPYRKKVDPETALAEIERCAGSQFDPHIATCFVEAYEKRQSK